MSVERVLVAGATGTQGGAVADHLLDQGYEVHALTRDAGGDAANTLAERGAEVVEGNLLDGDRLEDLLADVDGVYCVTTFAGDEGIDGEVEQGTTMAEAAADAGVEHFVFSSVGGAERDTGVPHFESKFTVEERIRDLDLPATVVRPVYFMANLETSREQVRDGTLAMPVEPGVSLQMVAPDDIGAVAAAAFADPDRYVGEAIELAGDEHTPEGTAAILSDVTGRAVDYQHVPIDAARDRMGEDLASMFEWINAHGYEADIDALRRDHDLTSLETYLRANGWAE